MRKAQGGVIGTVVLTVIVLLVITATYLWGRPIIQKNVDQARMQTVLQNMEDIDNAVKYAASTGSNTVLEFILDNSAIIVNPDENYLNYETRTTIPLVASSQEVPLNYYELATRRESITYNTTNTIDSDPIISGYEQVTHHSNTTINEVFYNVSVHENTASGENDLVCLWKDYSIDQEQDCAGELGAIVKEEIPFDVVSIMSDGTAAYLLGETIENKGVLGGEPSGIISGFTISTGDYHKLELYLTYRSLVDQNGEEYKIILTCDDCAAGGGSTTMRIKRENIIRTASGVNTIIKITLE